jgi:hypothetical protein
MGVKPAGVRTVGLAAALANAGEVALGLLLSTTGFSPAQARATAAQLQTTQARAMDDSFMGNLLNVSMLVVNANSGAGGTAG